MSGVVKGVKKVFKAVGKLIKKVAKPLLIAAAVYFTGGLALSAFPATAGFAASLPGFAGGGILGTGIGAGATAGTGIFSKLAGVIGLDAGLVAGAAKAGTAAATAAGTAAATGTATGATTGALTTARSAMVNMLGPEVAKAAATTVAGKTAAATGMSLTNKLLFASMGTQALGAFLAPTIDEQMEAQKRWRGAFYGTYGAGGGPAATPAASQGSTRRQGSPFSGATVDRIVAAQQQPRTAPQRRLTPAEPVNRQPPATANRQLMPSVPTMQRQTTNMVAELPAAPAAKAPAPPAENAPIEAQRQLMENVRYV